MSIEDKKTKTYTRCEACGKIARPEGDERVPGGWIELGRSEQFNAPRVVCSVECRRKIEGT
jgi:hypothetical protein